MRDGRHDERGATMVEYAFMIGLIAVVAAGAVALLGNATAGLFVGVPGF